MLIEKYTSDWVKHFDDIKSQVESALNGLEFNIEHVGKLSNGILDTVKHHLYVCPVDSKALEKHILSRDFLRKNDWARMKYQQIKYELAEKAKQDKKVYATLKELNVNDFIDSIIEEEKRQTTLHLQ
ncbi:GrpB family protein [Daejeonella sp.]|uniref:GrpB family protein n=1 Tax=Daejeonella sp. TaxID=2805397 RepID=UPI00273085D0|nr:GrpB family protein [Daejeonella sp.]MDP2414596.1 GrpB family protein [Daejeonella sp.]